MKWLASWVLLCVVTPATAQVKTLVVKGRAPTIASFDWHRSFALPTGCDENGNFYVRPVKPDGDNDDPLLMFSKTGTLMAKFDLAAIPAANINVYAIRPHGGISTISMEDGHSLVSFAPNGKRDSTLHLDSAHFFPSQLAIFPSGAILVSGIHGRTHEVPNMYKAFTAVYDAEGHLVKQLALDEDAEIERAVEAGDSRYTRSPNQGNRAVTLGLAVTGDDGNVYLVRRTSPATVFVVSPSGDVVRKLLVTPPSPGQLPGGMQVAKNRLAIKFYRECATSTCEGATYSVLEATTGKKLADYESGEDVVGTFTCYAPNPDRFFLVGMSDGYRLEILEAQPK